LHYAVGFLASSLYWPGIAGAASTPRWAFLFAAVPWMLLPRRMSTAHVAGALFIGWAILTIAWGAAPLDGVGALAELLLLAACFCLGNQIENLRPIIIGAALGLTVSSGFAVAQWWGFEPIRGGYASGLFSNGNYLAEAAALVIVGVIAERLWWVLPGLLPALLLPHARGAILAAVLGMIVAFRSRLEVVIALGGAVAIAGLWSAFHLDPTTLDRLDLWNTALRNVTFFGHGIGSFWAVYPDLDMRAVVTESPEFAHNEFLNIAFEIGIPGLVLALAFCATMAGPIDTSRLILIALAVESCFAFPLHLPTSAFLGAICAGHAVRTRYLLRLGALRGRRVVASRVAMPGLWQCPRTTQARWPDYAVSTPFSRGAVSSGAEPK
jgi:hypothetical protein